MPEDHFGPDVAPYYDARLGEMGEPAAVDATVDFLLAHARGGAALELGIGTGRIALPLRSRGVPVHGIDLSEAMLAQLRAKPGGHDIGVTVGDFAHARAPGTYRLAYLVFNTIMNLASQDEQVACFGNVAEHLEPGGRFVVEVGVPSVRRLPPGEMLHAFARRDDYLGVDEFDLADQRLVSHHYRISGDRITVHSVPFRYVWPAELDLMARIAGMTLHERWADWDRTRFTAESGKHISVWTKQ